MRRDNGPSDGGSSSSSLSVSLLAAAASKISRIGSGRNAITSPSAAKYKAAAAASNGAIPRDLDVEVTGPPEQLQAAATSSSSPQKPRSPSLRHQSSQKKKDFGGSSCRAVLKFTDLAQDPLVVSVQPQQEQQEQPSQLYGANNSKLPLKIRTSVSRMRSQRVFDGLPYAISDQRDERIVSPTKAFPSSTTATTTARPGHRSGSILQVTNTLLSSGSVRPKYTRFSQELSAASSFSLNGSSPERKASAAALARSLRRRSTMFTQPEHPPPEHPEQTEQTDPAALLLTFMELLRPLQNSMSSTSSSRNQDDGNADDNDDHDDDDDDDDADFQFRQHERESSRVLRIVCSLDNLLFAIADQVQSQANKLDLVAIANGPARDFVQLLLSGLSQITALLASTDTTTPGGSFNTKEEKYLRDFLVEMGDRWWKLDTWLRQMYMVKVASTTRELAQLQQKYTELKDQKQLLEIEMVEVRDFQSSQSNATLAMTSNLIRFASDHQQHSHRNGEAEPETTETEPTRASGDAGAAATDDDARYELSSESLSNHVPKQTAAEEIESLRNQCHEYARILEMAKQEIKLSHMERQSQHARLVELSQSLLKDHEVAQLRHELQAEKKRVKLLELESLRLRESEMDLNLKIQSFQRNGDHSHMNHSNHSGHSQDKASTRGAAGSIKADATKSGGLQRLQSQSASGDATTSESGGGRDGVPRDPPVLVGLATATGTLVTGDTLAAAASQRSPSTRSLSSSLSWFTRVVTGHSSSTMDGTTRPLSHPPTPGHDEEDDDDGLVRLFLANLQLTQQELEAAAAHTKLRKRANVPTLGRPPPSASATVSSSPTKTTKNKIPKTSSQDPRLVVLSMDDWTLDQMVVTSVRQLIWMFYEQYLMSQEVHQLEPRLCASTNLWWWRMTSNRGSSSLPSLASLIVHHFLERHVNEQDAMRNVRRFARVLSKLRVEYGDVRLFCEFLEANKTREELHFMLWVLQAVDSVPLGVSYDDDLPVGAPPPPTRGDDAPRLHRRLGRSLCTLKALYLTRMVYRLVHLKSLKRPTPVDAQQTSKSKTKTTAMGDKPVSNQSQSSTAASTTITSGGASPKKKRKARPASAPRSQPSTSGATAAALLASGEPSSPAEATDSIVDQARARYAQAIAGNSGYPLTLETFNQIILSFAESPSNDELRLRLGAFYQPTGDERKVSLDVFLVLVAELFGTQIRWRKTQLRALFIQLARQEELETLRLFQLQRDALLAAEATQAKKTPSAAADTTTKKTKKKSGKRRDRRANIDPGTDKYLRGLTRERLRRFVVQGGLVAAQKQTQQQQQQYDDVDALYLTILETTQETPTMIHFDQIYEVLSRLELLGNGDVMGDDCCLWLTQNASRRTEQHGEEKVSSSGKDADADGDAATERQQAVEMWQLLSSQSLTMVENDPNLYTRQIARQLTRRVESALVPSSSWPEDGLSLTAKMRDCLGFAWQVARRRAAGTKGACARQWTEVFYLNQAIRGIATATATSDGSGGDDAVDLDLASRVSPDGESDLLLVWYDCRKVDFASFYAQGDAHPAPFVDTTSIRGLQLVLQKHALCVAHLFNSYSTSPFLVVASGITKHQWLALTQDLACLHETLLPLRVCEELFVTTAAASSSSTKEPSGPEGLTNTLTRDLVVDKPGFVALVVHTAMRRHQAMVQTAKTNHSRAKTASRQAIEGLSSSQVPQIVDSFCRQFIVPNAFSHRNRMQEQDYFHRKRCDPLVAKVLLDHRAFLRTLFVKYTTTATTTQSLESDDHDDTKEAESATERPQQQPRQQPQQLTKSSRNSLTLAQFVSFLHHFHLLEKDASPSSHATIISTASAEAPYLAWPLDGSGAAYLFRAVMAIESDDHMRMELDEFTSAVAAMAALENPHPFVMWHIKIDAFVGILKRRHQASTH